MDLPTYTNIWRIEKRLYKLYDFRLPMPLPVGQIAVFAAIAVPYVVILKLAGLPFSHTLLWLYILPPGALAWLVTRPVLEGKRLPELVVSQVRYLGEPRTWCRMTPLAEKDEIFVVARVWRRVGAGTAAVEAPGAVALGAADEAPEALMPAGEDWPGRAAAVAAPQVPITPVAALRVAAPGGIVPGESAPADAAEVAAPPVPAAEVPAAAVDMAEVAAPPVPAAAAAAVEADAAEVDAARAKDARAAAPQAHPLVARQPRAWKIRARGAVAREAQAREGLAGEVPAAQATSAPEAAPSAPAAETHAPPAPETHATRAPETHPTRAAETPAAAHATAAPLSPARAVASPPAAASPVARRWPAQPWRAVRAEPGPDAAAPVPPAPAAAAASPARPAPADAVAPPVSPQPVVTVTGDQPGERPIRTVERALGNPAERRAVGWRDHVVVVPGGHRPGRPDQMQRDRARARLPLPPACRIVVLGCTVGAGQTVTALLTGELLASLRDDQVALFDLNPGPGSLAERARAVPALTGSAAPAPTRTEVVTRETAAAASRRPGDDREDVTRIFELLSTRYPLTLADPGAAMVPRVLAAASQLILVAPASQDAASALATTREWLEAHGHTELTEGAIVVLNGVSRHTMPHVEQAEALARGRCRAIVRIPWDDHLKHQEPSRPASPPAGARHSSQAPVALSPSTLHAYTALSGVLVAAVASVPEQLRARS